MRHVRWTIVLLAGVLGTAAAGAQPAAEPIRALLVTGGGFHDFEAQKGILTEGIAERTRITWTIDHDAGEATDALIPRHETTDWADQFDVVVYSMSFSHVTDADWIERIARTHRARSVPAVIIHGAVHSYRRSDTDAYRELIGVASYRHDAHYAFIVENVAPDHPIMRPFPAEWRTPNGELYEIARTWPTVTPLGRAMSDETREYQAVIWVNELPEVRVFGTTIGHHNETMAEPVYLDLVTRGLLWTLDRLQDDGTPVAGYGPSGGR